MPTFASDFHAIRALADYLQEKFITTYADNYSRHRVDVVLRTEEGKETQRIGKPHILVEQESGDRSEWSAADSDYRMVTALATATATDASGAIKRAVVSSVASHEQMSRDLINAIGDGYAALRDLGLQGIEIQAQRQVTDTSEKTSGEQRIPHRITFHYEKD